MTTIQQRLKAAQTIKRLNQIHEYYQDHPGCTINQAVTFIPETRVMVYKYSSIRSECQAVIESVLDVRYGCVWPVDKSQCFGNFNKELKSCCFCEVAVECYGCSDVGEVLPQGRS